MKKTFNLCSFYIYCFLCLEATLLHLRKHLFFTTLYTFASFWQKKNCFFAKVKVIARTIDHQIMYAKNFLFTLAHLIVNSCHLTIVCDDLFLTSSWFVDKLISLLVTRLLTSKGYLWLVFIITNHLVRMLCILCVFIL